MEYLILITFGFFLVYSFLFYLFPLFFKNTIPSSKEFSFVSLFYILISCLVAFTASFSVKDLDLSNRILHTFGGGFITFLVCFLVVKNTKLQISRFQFFTFSFLVVISLGAANEILEYFLQNYLSFSFAKSANDTWLDLISNTVGALIASVILVPFVKKNS
ncbi:MAG: hypothetical protein Q8Q90_02000 [bacterium]|nr:hypothetical protein [bacterium]